MVRKSLAMRVQRHDNLDMAPTKIILPKSILKTVVQPAAEEPTPEPETETTERRPSTPHMSFSQMSMYLRCSMQYYFRYIQGMKERPKVSLSIGKGGHAALEWNAKTKISTGADAPTEAVIQKASDMMDFYMSEMPRSEYEVDVEPGGTKDRYLAATRIYRVRDAINVHPIGAEVEFNLDMNEFQHPDAEPLPEPIRVINGKIDLLYDDVGTQISHAEAVRVGVEDEKYVGRKKTQNEVNISAQLSLYGVVVHKLTGRWPTKIGFRMFTPGGTSTRSDGPDSTPLFREPEHMTPEALTRRMARLAYQFRKVEQGIRGGIFIPTDDPMTCSWCGYRERCQKSLVNDFEAATIRSTTTPQ